MTLRDRLLAHLREASYSPANEFELSRRLGLNKKQRALLAHEVRLVLKSGEFARAHNGRIGPRQAENEKPAPRTTARPLFSPTRRGAAMLGPGIGQFWTRKPGRSGPGSRA